jgi:hypothetical protein
VRKLLFALLLVSTLGHSQEALRAKVLAVDSIRDFELWMESRPAPDASYPSIVQATVGRQVHFPIVATGLRPPERGEMKVVADVEFVGPDGKTLAQMKACCTFTVTNRPDIRTVLLGPTPSLVLEARDKKGIYSVKVSVTDGVQVAIAKTELSLGATHPPSTPSVDAPRLNQGTPPAKNPGGDPDKRDCLSLPTPAEVIKCTEKK